MANIAIMNWMRFWGMFETINKEGKILYMKKEKFLIMRRGGQSIALLFRCAPVPALLFLSVYILYAACTPLSLLCTQQLIDRAGAVISGNKTFFIALPWILLLLLTILFTSCLTATQNFLEISLRRSLNQSLTGDILEKFRRMEYACFEDPSVQDTLKRMGNGPQEQILNVFVCSISIISCVVSAAGSALVFMQASPWLFVVYIAAVAIIAMTDFRVITQMNNMFNIQTKDEREMAYLYELLSEKHSLLELRVFGAVSYILNKWYKTAKTVLKERLRVTVHSQKLFLFSCLTLAAWLALSIYILLERVQAGQLSLGLFIALIGAVDLMWNVEDQFVGSLSRLAHPSLQMEHYHKFMNLPETSRGEETEIDLSSPVIRFENVHFTYPKTEQKILDGVSFSIQPGEHVALVGENGSGKSTIVKLLFGLYQPDEGKITINGTDIRRLSPNQRHQVLSAVFQDYARYNLTLRENIAFGDIQKLQDDAALKEALRVGMAEDAVFESLDQNLGKLEEDGVDLSGGQWQRVAMARAVVSGSSCLVLDEPTAALDPMAESRMYQNFAAVMKGRGCVLISHRLASAKMCNKILVLDQGKIIEEGSHPQLIEQGGLYAQMFQAQSAWYQDEKEGGSVNG